MPARAMLRIKRRGIHLGADSEDEERRPDSQVIVRGNHERVTAFYLKSVTKCGSSSLTRYAIEKDRERG